MCQVIEDFKISLIEDGKSPKTIESYVGDIKVVTNGKTWKVMELDDVIGASGGSETNYMRVEMSGGTIHGHPITKAEYLKLTK